MNSNEALNLAGRLICDGSLDQATEVLETLANLHPSHAQANELLGVVAGKRGDFATAARYLRLALDAAHTDSDVTGADAAKARAQRCYYAGVAHGHLGKHQEAIRYFNDAVSAHPWFPEALHDLGLAHAANGDPASALHAFDRALQLRPDAFVLLYNKGRALGELGRYLEEIACYERAVRLRPEAADGHVNLGVALRDLHRFDEALRHFRKAVTLDANHVLARCNRAQTNLLLGVFEHGWREYEWRLSDGVPADGPRLPGTPWLGAPSLAGKTILLHGEQGLGDTIQFLRYVPLVVARGATVILRVQSPLVALCAWLADRAGVHTIIADDAPLPAFDFHCPLMSLPLAFNTRLDSIPAQTPYLTVDPARRNGWEARWQNSAPRLPRIGIAWSGSTTHRNDRNRSLQLKQLEAVLDRKASFISLQKEIRPGDVLSLDVLPQLLDVSTQLTDFTDTAALIDSLDLVITVDTSVAHLAGALRKPTWVLLPFTPDWRWMLDRADSPWYPDMRLFRQRQPDDWGDTLDELATALDGFLNP